MKKYDVIIFDLDGTLSNSKEGIIKSLQYALQQFGIEEPDENNLLHFIGPPLHSEVKKTYGFSDEEATKCVSLYRKRYTPIGLYETEIYPGTEHMLAELKNAGKVIALATSKPQEMAEEVLRHLGIEQYFEYVMGAELTGPRQSKTAVLSALIELLENEDKSLFLMVGDTCFDIEGANNVGIDSIGVSYGFGNSGEMLNKGALAIAQTTTEVLDLLV